MNSNNYNCLIKLADTLPDFSTAATELTKLSPEVALKAIQQNPKTFSDADRAGLTRLLTEQPAHSTDVINKLNKLAPNSPDSRNIAYSHIPNGVTLKPAYRPAPEPVMASFAPEALREFEKLSPTARLNVLNSEFNNGRLDSLSSLSSTAANNAIRNEFPALRPGDWNRDSARERWLYESRYPKTNSPINPSTGGYRITREPEVGNFTGPLPTTHSMRQGELPLVPSHAEMHPFTLRDARAQASAVQNALATNEANKRLVALNFDALFRDLHSVNQQRSQAGLPAYQPNMFDVYAPYASSRLDYAEAENRDLNDTAMSTITTEAARRGTPYNPAEINYMQRNMLPQNAQLRGLRERLPFISPKMKAFGGGDPYEQSFKANGIQFPR